MTDLTPQEIEDRLDAILAVAHDDGFEAVKMEVALYRDVLRAIAKGTVRPDALAARALDVPWTYS